MADWEWFFSSDYGRDRMLRDSIDSLQGEAASARSTNSRLSSQLTRLQGSLETRLNALSAAFDAYVELGDVREQLTAYSASATIRRQSQAAVRALSTGEPADLIDPGDEAGYWLADATDAVIALCAGTPDPAAEERARAASRDAELFMIVAAGALDRGSAVAARLPALLQVDSFDPARLAVFQAAVAGLYGESLPQLRSVVAPALQHEDPKTTADWVRASADSADLEDQLRWIDQQLQLARPGPADDQTTDVPRFDPPTAEAVDPVVAPDPAVLIRDELRRLLVTMIESGIGAEAELISRAAVLRSRIESPNEAGETAPPAPVPVGIAVRQGLAAAAPHSSARSELLDWMVPSLARMVDSSADRLTGDWSPVRDVRTAGGTVPVGPDGPDQSRLQAVLAGIVAPEQAATKRVMITAIATAGLTVLALLMVLLSQTVLAVLLLIAAVVVGIVAVRALMNRTRDRQEQAASTASTQQTVTEAVQAARREAEEVRLARARRSELFANLQAQLATGSSIASSTPAE